MLVLSRKNGDRVIIDTKSGQIVVTVVEIAPGKIRLGFDANRDIPIYRAELEPWKEEDKGK